MDQFGCPYSKDPKSQQAGTGGPDDGQFKNLVSGVMEKRFDGGNIKETTFRLAMNQDGCTTEKMAEGLRAFIADTDKLEAAIRSKL